VLLRQFFATLLAAALQNHATILGFHPLHEAVLLLGAALIRLICSFRHIQD